MTTDINALTSAEKLRAESLQVLLARQPVISPDIQGQQNRARDVVRGLEDQISAEQRRQMQLAETVDLRGQELRAAQASQQVLNEFADQQRDTSRALLDALNAEILATNVLVAATERLRAEDTDANRQALRAAQGRVAATQQAAAEAEALLDALAAQGPAYAALAMQLRSVLEKQPMAYKRRAAGLLWLHSLQHRASIVWKIALSLLPPQGRQVLEISLIRYCKTCHAY